MINLDNLGYKHCLNYPIDIQWLEKSLRMIQYNKTYPKGRLEECYEVIDILCLIDMYVRASMILEEADEDKHYIVDSYLSLLRVNEIDIFKMVLLAGEEYFEFSDYVYEVEEGENQINLLDYLIGKNYRNIVYTLTSNFNTTYDLFMFFAKSLGVDDRVEENDFSDYMDGHDSEIMRLYQWFDEGLRRKY